MEKELLAVVAIYKSEAVNYLNEKRIAREDALIITTVENFEEAKTKLIGDVKLISAPLGLSANEDDLRKLLVHTKEEEVADLLIKYLQKNFKQITLIHSPSLKNEKSFLQNKWEVTVRQTYHISLSDFNSIEDKFGRDVKRKIKKARDSGVQVSSVEITEKNIILFYELWRSSFERQNIKLPANRDQFVHFLKSLDNNKLCRLYFAYYLDKVVSGRLEILTDNVVYDLIAGNDSEYLGIGAGSFLMWQILKDMSGKYSIFDFVGADVSSIAAFKSRFGGKIVSHFMTKREGKVKKLKGIIKRRLVH